MRQVAPVSAAPPGMNTAPISRRTAHSALSGLPRCIVMLSGGATLTRPTIQAVLRAMRQVAPVSAAPPGMITAPISRMAAHSALSGLPRCIVMLSGGATLTRPTIQAAPCHETGSPGKRSATGDDHSADFPDGGAQRLIRATSLYCYVVGWRYAYPTYNTGRPVP